MDPNNPPLWPNPSFVDFTSYADQPMPNDYRHQPSAQNPYARSDWSERPCQGDQQIPGSSFNPAFQPSRQYLSQPTSYDASPKNLGSRQQQQQQPPRISFSRSNPRVVDADSSGLPTDPFTQSNEEYRRRDGGYPPQQCTTFDNQVLAQIPPPPPLYHPSQTLDHPGGQKYHHQALPLSDTSAEGGVLDLFGTPIRSRVPSQDGFVYRSLPQGIQC